MYFEGKKIFFKINRQTRIIIEREGISKKRAIEDKAGMNLKCRRIRRNTRLDIKKKIKIQTKERERREKKKNK